MKRTNLSLTATMMLAMGIPLGVNPKRQRPKTKAIQHKPIPAKTGNVLYDTINYMNSHMIFKGLRYPSKKTIGKKGSSGPRSAVMLREQYLKSIA